MERRTFLALVSGSLLAAQITGEAQQCVGSRGFRQKFGYRS